MAMARIGDNTVVKVMSQIMEDLVRGAEILLKVVLISFPVFTSYERQTVGTIERIKRSCSVVIPLAR